MILTVTAPPVGLPWLFLVAGSISNALLSLTASLAQISLATKTACAFLDAGQPARAETLIARIGETASAVASTDPAASDDSADKRTKILLAYYCCRIRIAVARKTTPVASWLRDRAKALLGRAETSWREVGSLFNSSE